MHSAEHQLAVNVSLAARPSATLDDLGQSKLCSSVEMGSAAHRPQLQAVVRPVLSYNGVEWVVHAVVHASGSHLHIDAITSSRASVGAACLIGGLKLRVSCSKIQLPAAACCCGCAAACRPLAVSDDTWWLSLLCHLLSNWDVLRQLHLQSWRDWQHLCRVVE